MITNAQIHDIVYSRQDEIIACLSEAVQTPSEQQFVRENASETACSLVYAKWARRLGFSPVMVGVNERRLNMLADWRGSQDGPVFLFNGHLDTHPRPDETGTYGPFSGMVADGNIYGVGASNMKSGNTAALFAMGLLKALGFDPRGTISVSFCVDELNGGRQGARWLIEHGFLKADLGICMDVSDRKLQVEAGAIYRIGVTYRSRPAPAHRPHPSTDALIKSMRALNELNRYRDAFIRPSPINPMPPNFSITTFHAGHAANTYADTSSFTIDCRVVPPMTIAQLEKDLRRILDGLKAKYDEMDYEYEFISSRPHMVIPDDSSFVKVCREEYQDMFDEPLELYRATAGADAQLIYEAYKAQMPVFGPSLFDEISTPDEKISIDHLLSFVELYMRILVRTTGS
ncbi:MAG TPA: M20 family metallopeptidase [Clostridia bacterium]|nr:M20 family metallopeptidase [Clostridia bacterium]